MPIMLRGSPRPLSDSGIGIVTVSPIFTDGSRIFLRLIILSACLDWQFLALLRCSFILRSLMESGESGSKSFMLDETGTGGGDKDAVSGDNWSEG